MEIGKAIYNILSNDSGVTAITTQIYGNEGKQGISFPAIVYTVVSIVPHNTKSGLGAMTSRVQISCFAETYEGANVLGLAVRAALADKANGSYGGVNVQNIKFDNSQDFTDNAGFDGVYHLALDFMAFYTI